MNDRRGDRGTEGDPRHRDDGDGHGGPKRESDVDGQRPDTRFLQLEMSRVLYAEAEEVAKPALRELLREAAKDHLRARFGDTITRLAHLAIDELLIDIEASLEVEDQIQRRRESGGTDDRLRQALGRTRPAPSPPPVARTSRRTPASRRRRG